MACPNIPAFPEIYFAILKTGATVLPVSLLLRRLRSPISWSIRRQPPSCASRKRGAADRGGGQEGVRWG